MSTMAEVLAKHQWYDATSDDEDPATGCTGCPDWFGSEDALDDGTFAAHQADALTKAGYGKLVDARAVQLGALMAYDAIEASTIEQAKADAWDEGWAHYRKWFTPVDPEFGINPYRSAS